MLHLGDITKISGYNVPIVDCVIGGSPCQDLSTAGKRAGLDGERSGLYIEQVRIVKEMREQDAKDGRSDVDIRPRYMVWENVQGAFSSGKPKGEDFRIVLEELAKVADQNATIPRPADGKWKTSGCIVADGWSIAWRLLDAQFWGTSDKPLPQRRRRIALVADFGGQSAPEILFVRNSVSGHTQPGESKRKAVSSIAERSLGADDRVGEQPYTIDGRGDTQGNQNCLRDRQGGVGIRDCYTLEPRIASREGGHIYENVSGTLRANAGDNQMAVAYIGIDQYNGDITGDVSATLGVNCGLVSGRNGVITIDKATPLVARDPSAVCYGIGSYHSNAMKSDNPTSGIYEADTARTLDSQNCGYPACNQGGIAVVAAVDCRNCTEDTVAGSLQASAFKSLNCNNVVRTRLIVRRLTPLECERLQGFPDGWTDIGEWTDSTGKKRQTSDAARYKALGNSIALPPWKWVLKRLCACYERDATMASLFDGIGGFPYLWEQLNGKGSCLWASEIEEYPMAVTKVRIGE